MENYFKDRAFLTENSLGRRSGKNLISSAINPYFQDELHIVVSQAFRRLVNKTQAVFPNHQVRICSTRMTHSQEVATACVFVADYLGLNTALCRTMGLIHDIGHTPFGHFGERFLSKKLGEDFRHEKFGVFVVQEIEPLDLTHEVLGFIPFHSRGPLEMTVSDSLPLCYNLGMYIDKICYTISDTEDAFSLGLFGVKQRKEYFALGKTSEERLMNCLIDLCSESVVCDQVLFATSPAALAFRSLRDFMYEKIYFKLDEIREEAQEEPLEKIFDFLLSLDFSVRKAVLTIALMTEHEILQIIKDLEISKQKAGEKLFNEQYPISFLLPVIEEKYKMNFLTPDLSWG